MFKKGDLVLYGTNGLCDITDVNSVLTLLASALGVVCVFWHRYNELLPEMNLVVYVWATVGVVFAVIMTVLAVLNLVRMKKRIAQ